MILYQVGYNDTINEVESERQTDHSVFINGNRNAWRSNFNNYFKTKQEAKDFCIGIYEEKIKRLNDQLEWNLNKLEKCKSL